MTSLVAQNLMAACLFFTTVTSQQPILSSTTIKWGRPFVAYCDASRVTTPDEGVKDVFALIMYRMNVAETRDVTVAWHFGLGKTSTDIDIGRNWRFTFKGDNNGTDNNNTMKIVWDIFDPSCGDAGTYICQVVYWTNVSGEETFMSEQTATVIEPCVLSILIPDALDDRPLFIQCDLSIFAILDIDVLQVSTLSVLRKLINEANYTVIAKIQSKVKAIPNSEISEISYKEYINKPPRRRWEVNLTGARQEDIPLKNMAISMLIKDPNATDAGAYRCAMAFINTNKSMIEVFSKDQWLFQSKTDYLPPFITLDSKRQEAYIFCNARRVIFPPEDQDITDIVMIQVFRGIGFPQTSPLVQLFLLNDTHILSTPPKGRNWKYELTDEHRRYYNTKTMFVQISTDRLWCRDMGVYRCQITYRRRNFPKIEKSVYNDNYLNLPCS